MSFLTQMPIFPAPGNWILFLGALTVSRCREQSCLTSTCCGSVDSFRGPRGVFRCASFSVPLGEGMGLTGRGGGRHLEGRLDPETQRGLGQNHRSLFSLVVGKTVLVLSVMTEGRGQIATFTVRLVSSPSPFPFPSLVAARPETGAPGMGNSFFCFLVVATSGLVGLTNDLRNVSGSQG